MRLENLQTLAPTHSLADTPANTPPPDPRRLLCETKYFGLRPQPLEQYLYRLRLPQAAERVFWLHWDLGHIQGDYTSEIALSEVARRIHCDISTCTRAYQTLKAHGLIRRQDPGRDPRRPFAQAIALTEVLIPRTALPELMAAPARTRHAAVTSEAQKPASVPNETIPNETAPQPTPRVAEPASPVDASALWNSELEALKTQLPADDFAKWLRPLQAHTEGTQFILFAPNRFSLDWIQTHLKTRLEQTLSRAGWNGTLEIRVGSRNAATSELPPPPTMVFKSTPRPRQLGSFCLARLRGQLAQHCPLVTLDERLREIVWSIEQGALAHREIPHAINTALKLIRQGVWTRPNRMPPNWRLPA